MAARSASKHCRSRRGTRRVRALSETEREPRLDQGTDAPDVEAASQDLTWKAIDRYSQDYVELETKHNVKFYKTPDAILQKQLEVFDQIADKKSSENALFKEVLESQKAFAERVVRWDLDTYVNRRIAYSHYFGPKIPARKS